jgi:hypothetical protein
MKNSAAPAVKREERRRMGQKETAMTAAGNNRIMNGPKRRHNFGVPSRISEIQFSLEKTSDRCFQSVQFIWAVGGNRFRMRRSPSALRRAFSFHAPSPKKRTAL